MYQTANPKTLYSGAAILKSEEFFFFLVLVLAALSSLPAAAQASTPSVWTGQWIACPNAPARDEGVFHFRKNIRLAEYPRPSPGRGERGQSVCTLCEWAARRERSCSRRSWPLEIRNLDLAPFLHSGANWIGATVWNFGARSAIAQVSDRTGFYINSIDKKYSSQRNRLYLAS